MMWIVLSTARPSAIEAMMLVPRFSAAPEYPISPKKTTIGKRFGNMAMNPMRADRNITDRIAKITPLASARLSICPATMLPVVRVSRIKFPVGWTESSGGNRSAA
jgi:hypothetical protein